MNNCVLNLIIPMSRLLTMVIAAAFVTGTLVSGVVYADEKNGKPFEAIWEAIYELQNTENEDYSPTTYVNEISFDTKEGGTKISKTVHCDPGDVVVGGAGSYNFEHFSILNDVDFPDVVDGVPVGWTYEIWDLNSRGGQATVSVVCLDNP